MNFDGLFSQGNEHKCTLTCGKKLKCGKHKCMEPCHPGVCPPCLMSGMIILKILRVLGRLCSSYALLFSTKSNQLTTNIDVKAVRMYNVSHRNLYMVAWLSFCRIINVYFGRAFLVSMYKPINVLPGVWGLEYSRPNSGV